MQEHWSHILNQEEYLIRCDDQETTEPVLVFSTQDTTRCCMITQEPIHESNVEFCPNATLQHPFEKYNGIRLRCSHEFNATCLVWFWILNRMVCPCCRFGENESTFEESKRASVCNFSTPHRGIFADRKVSIELQEETERMRDAEASVLDDWVDITMIANIQVQFSPQLVLYMYRTNGMVYTSVIPLHRCANDETEPLGAAFHVQRSDLRMISRHLENLQIESFRCVLFLYDGYNASVVMQSPMVHSETRPILQENMVPDIERIVPSFSVFDDASEIGHNLVPALPEAAPAQLNDSDITAEDITEEQSDFHMTVLSQVEQGHVISRIQANGITFTHLHIESNNGMGDIDVHMEEPVGQGILHRISEIKWITDEEEYEHAMELMQH
jgi:hypothetical protein